ncbi:MAG: hypothetical protein DRG30_09610 [Epsilonproteobacteria bacterium]|nr:MAG: hypothetical protein DRG30_09610 [Campylobacterota bacterium]
MSKKHRRKLRKIKRKYRDRRGLNRHHLTPKSVGGSNAVQNLLRIYIYKHQEWHRIFKLLTLEQVIELLKRVKRAKDNQSGGG